MGQTRSNSIRRTGSRYNLRGRSQRSRSSSCFGNFLQTLSGIWSSYLNIDCVLSNDQLVNLSTHVYQAVDTSWLDEICMKRFWNFVVEFYPLWLAPNVITIIGLGINILTVFILALHCFSATESAPFWAYLQAALGLFLYQTLDATDGKQARRTKTSSPLGELFDHGCDSMAQIYITLNVCFAMQLGTDRSLVFLTLLISMALFYTAHWSTYCTGQLRFAKFDVTEAQMLVIGILMITSVIGPGIWNIQILGYSVKFAVMFFCFICASLQFVGYLRTILTEGVGRNGSTVAGTSVISPLFPLLLFSVFFAMLYYKSPSGILDDNITMLALCFGAVGAKITNRLIIAHMSRSGLQFWDWIYVSPLMMILNQYYDFYLNEFWLLIFATVYAYLSLIVFCTSICYQFCDYLNIRCFHIQVTSPKKAVDGQAVQNGPVNAEFRERTSTNTSRKRQ